MKITSPSASTLRLAGKFALWSGATWLVLNLHETTIAREHSICGPWGCGPTISALLSAHGFWLMVAVPGSIWASHHLPLAGARRLGWACLGAGIGGIGAVAWGAVLARPRVVPVGAPTDLAERILFALVTTVQVPLVPTVLAGLILLRAGRRLVLDRERGHPSAEGCSSEFCNPVDPPAQRQRQGPTPVVVGQPLPRLTLRIQDGRALVVPEATAGRAAILYFMRDANCSICRRHVRALGQIFGDLHPHAAEVFIVHPGDIRASRALGRSLPSPFTVASGRDGRAYDAIGLSGRNLGLAQGSGTILIDREGIVRHARLASLPHNAFAAPDLLDHYFALAGEDRHRPVRARTLASPIPEPIGPSPALWGAE